MSSRACARLWVSSADVCKQTDDKLLSSILKQFYPSPSISLPLYHKIFNLKTAEGAMVILVEMTQFNIVGISKCNVH